MECPVDGSVLQMTIREGVEIDYCPKCRGVWLDRGELDKIIERASGPEPVAQPDPRRRDDRDHRDIDPRRESDYRRDDDYRRDKDDYRYGKSPYKKRKSILSEIFDFD